MVTEVLSILKNDSALMALIDGTSAEPHIYLNDTNYLGNCIVYQWIPTTDNKIIRTDRLQITVIADTLEKAIAIEDRVKQLILTLADESLTNNIKRIELNGGGSLYDYERQKNHRILYFNTLSIGGK